MASSTFQSRFVELADHCQHETTAVIVYHQAGSAVEEHVNEASLATRQLRARFQPKIGALLRWVLVVWRFLAGKVVFRHLFVMDATIPRDGSGPGMDQLVRQLGFEVSPQRQVEGSRSRIVWRYLTALVAAIGVPLLRYVPELKDNPLVRDSPTLLWLYDNAFHGAYLLPVSLLIAAILFVVLEWRANLLGLLKPRPELRTIQEELAFIVQEVRSRQTRSVLWLFLELPLIYVLVPLLLLAHLVLLLLRLASSLLPLARVFPRLRSWLRHGPARRSWPHLAWGLGDLLILAAFWAGWDSRGLGDFWAGLCLSSAVFLGICSLREAGKLLWDRRLSLSARDHRKILWAGCGITLLLVLLSAVPWFSSALPLFLSPVLLFVGTVLLAWVRWQTQTRKWVLLRIGEAQRLGNDFQLLVSSLAGGIPSRLLVVGLWNTDEVPETPTGHEALHIPADTADSLLPRLRALLRPRFGISLGQTLPELARYLAGACHGVREPYRWFKARLLSLGQTRSDVWRLLYLLLPRVVARRARFYTESADASSLGGQAQVSWKKDFADLRQSFLEHWRAGELKGVSPDSRDVPELIGRLIQLFRNWEADTLRFHLEVLAHRKQGAFPRYLEHLGRLAQLVGLNGEEALAFESHRAGHEGMQRRQHPSLGVPLSLCREAGILAELSADQAQAYAEDYQREGFLESANPVIFRPAWLSFLTTGYLPAPLLYAEHESIIRRLTEAGRRDRRFLKVAAEWCRYVRSDTYFALLRGRKDSAGGAEKILTRDRQLDLALRSAGLLLDYYDALSTEGIAGVEEKQLERELNILAGAEADSLPGAASIPGRLSAVCDLLGQENTEHRLAESCRQALENLEERWRRLQVRRFLLRGEFNLTDPDLPEQPTALGRLLAPTDGEEPGTKARSYQGRQAHDRYSLGLLAVEQGRPLEALPLLAEAAALAAGKDEVLTARVQLAVARCLRLLGLVGRASLVLEHLYESYSLYLRDDPLLLQVRLEKAVVDSQLWVRSPLITGKVQTRWLGPLRQLAASTPLPAQLASQVELAHALYEEKRGQSPEQALDAASAAHVLLQDAQTQRWPQQVALLHLARLARRCGRLQQFRQWVNEDFLLWLKQRSVPAYLEACHTLARDHFAQARFDRALAYFGRMIELGLNPQQAQSLPATPDKLPEALAAADVEEGLEELFLSYQPDRRIHVPWVDVLDAAQGISDIYRVQTTVHEFAELPNEARRQALQRYWVLAYHWLAVPLRACRRYLHQAASVPLLSDPEARNLPATAGPLATLRDVYSDAAGEGPGEQGLALPMRRILEQLRHSLARIHLGLTFYLPPQDDAPAAFPSSIDLRDQPLLREQDGALVLDAAFGPEPYLRSLEDQEFDRLNSATLRGVCDWCRLYLLQILFDEPAPGMEEIFDGWLEEAGMTFLPHRARLLLCWEQAGGLARTQAVFQGLLDNLGRSELRSVPGVAEEERLLRQQLQGLGQEREESPSYVETVQHDLLRVLARLRDKIANHFHQESSQQDVGGHEAQREARLLPFAEDFRRQAHKVVDCYEKALSALYSHAENDLLESVLNRLTILEGLRDLGWLLRERKRTIYETLRTNLARAEQLFLDLDQLSNKGLTAWVKHSFFPHWDDIRKSLKEIERNVHHLASHLLKESQAE